MKPEDVPAALVEKAARAMREAHTRSRLVTTWEGTTESVRDQWRNDARHALAAVLPEIQAQALRDAADRLHARTDGVNREGTKGWPERHREVYAHAIDEASDALREDAARLTDTTEEPTK